MQSDSDIRAAAGLARADEPDRFDSEHRVACLGMVFPRDVQQCFKLDVAPRTIGSGRNADIVLNGDRIAPIHCRVSVDDGQVLIEDLGTSSGTWVDDVRVDSARLNPGQMVRIGHYRFMLGERATAERDNLTPVRQAPGADRVIGIPNRAWILRRAEHMLEARADSPRPITLAMLLLDQLDQVRREQGYRAGDALLRGVARLVESRLREKESVGLFGPEKLLLIMPEVSLDDANARLDIICCMIREQRFEFDDNGLGATLSVGYSTREGRAVESLDRFLAEADRALYQARRWGGDQATALP